VEVSDGNLTLPVAPAPEHQWTSGGGLRIVDNLADRWGVTSTDAGKTLWFELQIRPRR
jgi:hypothetical protein